MRRIGTILACGALALARIGSPARAHAPVAASTTAALQPALALPTAAQREWPD
jgi:hypothetical protein